MTVLAAAALTAASASTAAQQPAAVETPWPGARCFALDVGRWRAWYAGDTTARLAPIPNAPDLIILDSARLSTPLGMGSGDTANRVVRGRSRNRGAATPEYVDFGWDPWFTWWKQPTRDSLEINFGSGHGGLWLGFRQTADSLVGLASTYEDRAAPEWRAAVVGRPTRCPAPPPRAGRLTLTVAEVPGPDEAPLPEIAMSLATEEPYACGHWVNDTFVRLDTLLAWTLYEVRPPVRPCAEGRRPATTSMQNWLRPGRHTLLIESGRDTNQFSLTVTDSTLVLVTERATFVTANDGIQRRPRHNLFLLRCSHGGVRAPCDEVEQWLFGLPGITRVGLGPGGGEPYHRQINEGVWIARFRYDSAATLGRVRTCLASIERQLRMTSGVYITIETWLREEMTAHSSDDKQPPAPVPSGVTGSGCAR
jgi:hypothetical protein